MTRPPDPTPLPLEVRAEIAREVRRWVVRLAVPLVVGLAIVAFQAIGQPIRDRAATLDRCEVDGENAGQLAEALEAIHVGNRRVALDPFQSAETRSARLTENVELREAVVSYYARAAEDCDELVPPAFPLVGELGP